MPFIIKQPNEEKLKQLAKLYKQGFKKHNIFSKDDKFILNYLKKPTKMLAAMAEDESEVVGGICLFENKQTEDHSVWNFKHIAVKIGYQKQGVGASLMQEAEAYAKPGDKIEIKVSENEKAALKFYEKFGYVVEGKLSNHYRKDEVCYVLGKTVWRRIK